MFAYALKKWSILCDFGGFPGVVFLLSRSWILVSFSDSMHGRIFVC